MKNTSIPHDPMRVLHIITGLGNGGAEGAMYRLISHDTTDRHVVISLGGPEKYGPLLEAAGIEVHYLNLNAKTALTSLWKLVRLIKNTHPDIVQTWLYHADVIGGVAAKIAGVKNIVWGIRGASIDPDRAKKSTTRMVRIAARLSRIIPSHIISCSAKASNDHALMGYPSHLMSVVPNGYDLSEMKYSEIGRKKVRAELKVDPDHFLIGMAARFDPQKDHENLFDAFSNAFGDDPQVRLVLAGTGCDYRNSELIEIIDRKSISDQVILAGQRTDMPDFYSALDLHVLSSAYGEGFPNAIAEAMACGVPAVGTDVGETGVIIGNIRQVVSARNPLSLSQAMKSVREMPREDPSAFQRLREKSRKQIVQNFDISVMQSGFKKIWKNCIS
jgi:glycosyltransferase involved in cell wall biosynthesis